MPSEEVVNQIIRAVVSLSEAKLKQGRYHGQDESEANQMSTNADSSDPKEARAYYPSQVSDTLAAFMIRSVALNPDYKFSLEKEMPEFEVERLTNIAVDMLTRKDDPEIETIRTQVFFDSNFPSQDDFLQQEKLSKMKESRRLLKEIIEIKTKNAQGYEALNTKIVAYVVSRSRVGDLADSKVIRETTAALDSVFPPSELPGFMALSKGEKEAQLNGLSNLVTGIRLFNKHLGKGGENIEDLAGLCTGQLNELTAILDEETLSTEAKIQQYKAVMDYYYSQEYPEMTEAEADAIRKGLVFQRQYLVYLDAIRHQCIQSDDHLVQFEKNSKEIMTDLVQTCKSKSAVPVDQVYPNFIKLATMWTSLFDLLFKISYLRGVLDKLVLHSGSVNVQVSNLHKLLSQKLLTDVEPPILPDEEIVKNASNAMAILAMVNRKVEVLHPGNTTQYYQLPVEFGGFCAWSLLKKDGLVIPGDKNHGIYKYKDKIYVFADVEKASDFFKAADDNISSILQLSRHHPCYVQLLHLFKYFPTVDKLETTSIARQKLLSQTPLVSDASSQVDTHILNHYIDKNYFWNEWDLRRRALKLVSLKSKLTHSSQTVLSNYRQDSETQHYAPKPVGTQTRKSSGTNVPRTVHYLAGLRNDTKKGSKDMYQLKPKQFHFKVVDLSIDLDGSPVPYPKVQ